MPQINPNLRNLAIILIIAGLVDAVPGGGSASSTALEFVYLAFLGAFVFVATRLYREHRTTVYSLGTRNRAALYAAIGVIAVLLTGVNRFWHEMGPAGNIIWLVLFVGAFYAIFAVVRTARRY